MLGQHQATRRSAAALKQDESAAAVSSILRSKSAGSGHAHDEAAKPRCVASRARATKRAVTFPPAFDLMEGYGPPSPTSGRGQLFWPGNAGLILLHFAAKMIRDLK